MLDVFLSTLTKNAFPEISEVGGLKQNGRRWTRRHDFVNILLEIQPNVAYFSLDFGVPEFIK